jgi:hypothetical protein
MPAPNERFCVIAAVTSQVIRCKSASSCPVASSVEAATTQGRHPVVVNAGQCLVLKYVDSFFVKKRINNGVRQESRQPKKWQEKM